MVNKYNKSLRMSLLMFILMLSFLSNSCYAYKVNTHAYIAQQVYNDIADDGKIEFEVNNETVKLNVSNDIKKSILSNHNYYLMGSIGPDATPDVLVGQTVIHPGSGGESNKWDVNNWLDYLSKKLIKDDKEKAFYYGYLSHVASDVFAHTYVNQYTGDIFDLGDGEISVEKRHIALEAYIDEHTPPFKDHKGRILSSNAFELINLDDHYGKMIRDTFVYSDDVYNQYKLGTYSKHLVAYKGLRDKIDSISKSSKWRKLDKMVIKIIAYYNNIDLDDEQIEMILDGREKLNKIFTQHTIDYLQEFDVSTYENIKKWEELGYKRIVRLNKDILNIQNDIIETKKQIAIKAFGFQNNLIKNGCELTDKVLKNMSPLGVTDILLDPEFHISKFRDPLSAFNDSVEKFKSSWGVKAVCNVVSSKVCKRSCIVCGKVCRTVEKNICTNPNPSALFSTHFNRQEYDTGTYFVNREYSDIDLNQFDKSWSSSLELAYSLLRDKYIPIVNDGIIIPIINSDDVVSIIMTLDKLLIYRSDNYIKHNQGKRDLILEYDFKNKKIKSKSSSFCKMVYNSIHNIESKSIKEIYRLERRIVDKEKELVEKRGELRTEIVKISDEVQDIKHAVIDLTQALNQNVTPIQSYFVDWRDQLDEAMIVYSISASTTMINTIDKSNTEPYRPMLDWFKNYHGALIGTNRVNEISNSLANILESLQKIQKLAASTSDPVSYQIYELVEELKEEILEEVKERVKNIVIEKVLPDDLKELLNVLNDNIGDSELNYYFTEPENGKYKGLLMIADISERVKREMHLINGHYDQNRYNVIYNSILLSKLALLDNSGLKILASKLGLSSRTVGSLNNIVSSSFTNIDANHQWMEVSPPLPRDIGFAAFNNDKTYSNEGKSYSSYDGFFLWGKGQSDELYRNQSFRVLFRGPLTPGIDSPEMIGMSSLVTEQYKNIYNPNKDNPFPSLY